MKIKGLQAASDRLSGALMSNKSSGNKLAWSPYLPPGVSLPEDEASDVFFPEEEAADSSLQKRWQEPQAPGAMPVTEVKTNGERRESLHRPGAVSQRRMVLRKAVVLSEIIGEPACRKRKRKAYGNQGNSSRG